MLPALAWTEPSRYMRSERGSERRKCNYFEAFEENESDDVNHVYQFPVYLSLFDTLKPKY